MRRISPLISALKGDEAGDSFEQFIFMELKAYLGLNEIDTPIEYWRNMIMKRYMR